MDLQRCVTPLFYIHSLLQQSLLAQLRDLAEVVHTKFTVSTLVKLNLVTTNFFHCILHLQASNPSNDYKRPCTSAWSQKFHTLTVLPHLPPLCSRSVLASTPTNSLPITVELERTFSPLKLDRKFLNSSLFLNHLINTRNI